MYIYIYINIYSRELVKEVVGDRGVKLQRNECSVKFAWLASSSWHTTGSQVEIPEDGRERIGLREVKFQPIERTRFIETYQLSRPTCYPGVKEEEDIRGGAGDLPGLGRSVAHGPRMRGMLLLMSMMMAWFVAAEVFLGDVDEPSKWLKLLISNRAHSGRNVQLRCKNNSIVILSMSIYLFLWGDNHRVRHIFLTFFSNRISNLFGWLYVFWFLY